MFRSRTVARANCLPVKSKVWPEIWPVVPATVDGPVPAANRGWAGKAITAVRINASSRYIAVLRLGLTIGGFRRNVKCVSILLLAVTIETSESERHSALTYCLAFVLDAQRSHFSIEIRTLEIGRASCRERV